MAESCGEQRDCKQNKKKEFSPNSTKFGSSSSFLVELPSQSVTEIEGWFPPPTLDGHAARCHGEGSSMSQVVCLLGRAGRGHVLMGTCSI